MNLSAGTGARGAGVMPASLMEVSMALTDLIPWGRNRSLTPLFSDDRNPFVTLHRDMSRLLDDFSRGFGPRSRDGWPGLWPHVEVIEADTEVKIAAELPGLDEKDVELSLHDGVLTIKGEKGGENGGAHYTERWHGQFQRSFQVGAGIDPDGVSAHFKKGVLSVTLRKRPEAQAQVKRIPISAD
jgi:HSP20 family protein